MKLRTWHLQLAGCASVIFYPLTCWFLKQREPKRLRFYDLQEEIKKTYHAQDYEYLEILALEFLELATLFPHDWNYGNAIHSGHQSLGLVRLREGQIEKAKAHLLEAGASPGSPQLDSYGPTLLLARELLERGERETVLLYLDLVARFWANEEPKLPAGPWREKMKIQAQYNRVLLESWKAQIRAGQFPQHEKWQ